MFLSNTVYVLEGDKPESVQINSNSSLSVFSRELIDGQFTLPGQNLPQSLIVAVTFDLMHIKIILAHKDCFLLRNTFQK